MPRVRGMAGPGSVKMGGGGAKPGAPPTPMRGAAPRPPAGLPSAGAPPPRVAPPVGLAGPAPGGAPPRPGAGMGSSGGFKKGGDVEKFAKGGAVKGGGDTKPRHKSSGPFK